MSAAPVTMPRPMRSQTGRSLAVLLAAAAFVFLTFAPAAGAAEGFPDPTFGTGGFTIFDELDRKGEFLTDLVVLPDGKILGAGGRGGASGFVLARFNSNGTPDTSFGGEGLKVEPDLEQAGDRGTSPR